MTLHPTPQEFRVSETFNAPAGPALTRATNPTNSTNKTQGVEQK